MIHVQLKNTIKKNYIETVFKHQNSYPTWVSDKVIKQVQQAEKVPTNTANENENGNKKIHRLLLPYQGCSIIKSVNKCVNKLFPKNTKIEIMFKSTKLSSCFDVKDKIDFEHNHDLIYHTECPETTCINNYVGESARRITKRTKDQSCRDHTSHVLKHSIEKSQ